MLLYTSLCGVYQTLCSCTICTATAAPQMGFSSTCLITLISGFSIKEWLNYRSFPSLIATLYNQDVHFLTSRTLYLVCECNDDNSGKAGGTTYKGSHELLKCANLLFSTLEPCYIWIYAGTLFDEACERQTTNNENASPEHELSPKGEIKSVGSGPPNLSEV